MTTLHNILSTYDSAQHATAHGTQMHARLQRVVIDGDNRISKNKHALITYEPKRKNYYLQPGDSSGLTYLNDEYMTDSQKLNPYDIIELGNSKFVFVPLCGEKFSWEEFVQKGE